MIELATAADFAIGQVGKKASMLSRAMRAGFAVPDGIVVPPGVTVTGESIARSLGGTRFAVRSSAPDEDTAAASMAGQFDTMLDVGVDELEGAVELVRQGIDRASAGGAGIPVLIQPMIDPLFAGVGFSIDPVGGAGDITTAEVVAGRGDAVTDGSVTPVTIRRTLGHDGLHRIEHDGAAEFFEADRICDLVDELAAWHGTPVDIEFAGDGSTLWLLQVRPVTAIGFGAIEGIWTSANLRDSLSDTVSTLTASTTLERTFPAAFDAAFRAILNLRTDSSLVTARALYARPYWRVDRLREQMHRLPGHDSRVFDSSVGIEHDPTAAETTPGVRQVLGYPAVAARALRYVGRIHRAARACAVRTSAGDWPIERRAYSGAPETSAERLRAALDRHHEIYLLSMQVSLIAEQALDALRVCAESVARRTRSEIHPAELMSDLGPLATGAGARAIARVAARHRERAAEVLAAATVAELPAPVGDDLEEVAVRFGYLCFCDDELSNPRWDENPAALLTILQANLRAADGGAVAGSGLGSRYARARRALLSGSRLRRPLLALVLAQARSWAVLREKLRACAARQNYLLRMVALEAGDRLAAAGRLACREDVFWLTSDELVRAAEGAEDIDFALRARNRRGHASSFRHWEVPETLQQSVAVPTGAEGSPVPASGSGDLHGIGCSFGIAEGPARVIEDAADLVAVDRHDILIVRTINPGWAGVFGCARGLIAENGGMLSHGSILAREQGLPAVVGVRGATTRIATGDIVRIDGSSGKVVRR